jgi:hypothetical protein
MIAFEDPLHSVGIKTAVLLGLTGCDQKSLDPVYVGHPNQVP